MLTLFQYFLCIGSLLFVLAHCYVNHAENQITSSYIMC